MSELSSEVEMNARHIIQARTVNGRKREHKREEEDVVRKTAGERER